jgi:hypothetical protein
MQWFVMLKLMALAPVAEAATRRRPMSADEATAIILVTLVDVETRGCLLAVLPN